MDNRPFGEQLRLALEAIAPLFFCICLMLAGYIAVSEQAHQNEIERLEKQKAIEVQSAIDSPYPSRQWYEARIEQLEAKVETLEQEKEQLYERVDDYESQWD